jgi:adenylate cyclase
MSSDAVSFGRFRLDLGRRELLRDGAQVQLGGRALDILCVLASAGGNVVTKDELMRRVWPNIAVEEGNIHVQISAIRKALDQGESGQRYVITIPGRGYRFAGPTLLGDRVNGTPSVPPSPPDRPSVAILPFANMSGDPGQDYFSDGITDDIITDLSRFSELLVIARNSSFQYKGKSVDIRQVGRELGVRYVLEGGIRRAGERIRISAQLIDATTGAHRWADRYDRKLDDTFAVQDEVVGTIVAILAAHVRKAETGRSRAKPPKSWQAYDYYLQAIDALASFTSSTSVEDLYEIRRLLEQSLSIDPNFARSYAMLANAYAIAWLNPLDCDFLRPETLEEALRHACKAVQLDPNLPDAHAYLGLTLTLKHRHDASLAAFQKAIALNPNYLAWRFGLALVHAGNPKRAIDVLRDYMRRDPFYAPLASGFLGFAYYMRKQYSDALGALLDCVSRAPNHRSGHIWLAATHARLNQFEEASASVAEVLRLQPNYTISGTSRQLSKFKYQKDSSHFFGGLIKAGLPE